MTLWAGFLTSATHVDGVFPNGLPHQLCLHGHPPLQPQESGQCGPAWAGLSRLKTEPAVSPPLSETCSCLE